MKLTSEHIAIACDWIKERGLDIPDDSPLMFVSSDTKFENLLDNHIPLHLNYWVLKYEVYPYIHETTAEALCSFLGLDRSFFHKTGHHNSEFTLCSQKNK